MEFRIILILSAIILFFSLIQTNIAKVLNFTRFYAITLLSFSPCFVFGGLALIAKIRKINKQKETIPKTKIFEK